MSIKAKDDREIYDVQKDAGREYIFAERVPQNKKDPIKAFREARGAQAEYQADVNEQGLSFHCQVVTASDHYQIWVGPQTRIRTIKALPGERIVKVDSLMRKRVEKLSRGPKAPRRRAQSA